MNDGRGKFEVDAVHPANCKPKYMRRNTMSAKLFWTAAIAAALLATTGTASGQTPWAPPSATKAFWS